MPSTSNNETHKSTPLTRKWDELDGVRGYAILMVVMVHYWARSTTNGTGFEIKLLIEDAVVPVTWLFASGGHGVRVFFVLSGFLLFRQWLDRNQNTSSASAAADFFVRRARRILPAYLFFVAVYLLMALVIGSYKSAASVDWVNLISNLAFVSPIIRWLEIPGWNVSSLDVVPGTWSLTPEVWFYALMPPLAIALLKTGKWTTILGLCALLVASPIYRASLGPEPEFIDYFNFLGSLDLFVLGMIAAWWSKYVGATSFDRWMVPIGTVLFVVACTPWGEHMVLVDGFFHVGLCSAVVIAGLSGAPLQSGAPFRSTVLMHLGKISYSLFLCHIMIGWYICGPLAEITGFNSVAERFALNFTLGFGLSWLASIYAYRYIEAPWMRPGESGRDWRVARPISLAVAIVLPAIGLSHLAMVYAPRSTADFEPRLLDQLADIERSLGWQTLTGPGVDISIRRDGILSFDSSSRGAAISGATFANGELSVEGIADVGKDIWIAVYLPIDKSKISRSGARVRATATIISDIENQATLCLGIYNGVNDVCSVPSKILGTSEYIVRTTVHDKDAIHIKLNIRPTLQGERIKFRVSRFAVEVFE
jgi:peptidoglycan/LPS O-acetylase OafA/YrhL